MSALPQEFDPFNPTPDPEGSKRALIRSLEFAQGFTLLIIVCNSATERHRLIDEIQNILPNKKIWRVSVTVEVPNLFHLMQETVPNPPPEIVFVYGLEYWLSGTVRPRSIPFLRNLNAARDAFPLVVPCPVIFLIPQYVLEEIADAAPDFLSVRSGIFTFPLSDGERLKMRNDLGRWNRTEILGLDSGLLDSRISELQGLLSEIRSQPERERSRMDEALILNRLGLAYSESGLYIDAEAHSRQALELYQKALPPEHPYLAPTLSNLAVIYKNLGMYEKAEPLYQEALRICRATLPKNHPNIAHSLNNIGMFYKTIGKLNEAEACYLEALTMRRLVLPNNHPSLAISLNNLGELYRVEGRLTESERCHSEALEIRQESLPSDHPDIANSLGNLALVYEEQGRYGDVESLYRRAVEILQKKFGTAHPSTQKMSKDLESFRKEKGVVASV
jgi:tetratricopeptide (TPR) repeat protein